MCLTRRVSVLPEATSGIGCERVPVPAARLAKEAASTNPGNVSPATRCPCAEYASSQPETALPTTDCTHGSERSAHHGLNGAGVWGRSPRHCRSLRIYPLHRYNSHKHWLITTLAIRYRIRL